MSLVSVLDCNGVFILVNSCSAGMALATVFRLCGPKESNTSVVRKLELTNIP